MISILLTLFIIIGVGIKCYGFSLQQEKENLKQIIELYSIIIGSTKIRKPLIKMF